MLSPLPRHSDGRSKLAHPVRRISLPRYGRRVGLCIGIFEAYSAFTRVTACTLALATVFRGPLSEGFSHFVTSMTAPVASGGSIFAGWGFHPLEKRRLGTAHTQWSRPKIRKAVVQRSR